MGERGEVTFGKTVLCYRVVRSERRTETVTLSVSAQGLEVHAPATMAQGDVRDLVLKKAPWIVRKQTQLEPLLRNPAPPRRFVDGESVTYLGRHYRLKRVAERDDVRLRGRYLEVPFVDAQEIRNLLIDWYKTRAAEHFAERVDLYSQRLGHAPSKVLVRDQKKRWGSCNAKGEIRLNWRVVMAPVALIDYVVAHELCHLVHMNHSPDFWRTLRRILPDYKARQLRLDREGQRFSF